MWRPEVTEALRHAECGEQTGQGPRSVWFPLDRECCEKGDSRQDPEDLPGGYEVAEQAIGGESKHDWHSSQKTQKPKGWGVLAAPGDREDAQDQQQARAP